MTSRTATYVTRVMFILLGVLCIWAWTVFLTHCTTPAILTPPSSDYPCGVSGRRCPGGGCCNADTEECGGPIPNSPQTCPTGFCCATGGDGTTMYSRVQPRRQTPAQQ